ncbi:MAG: hypothetical protein ACD_79C01221G0001 [uncultured bacterium]|nr:MAG: hypothetical protein ACD_79C01221G0001 [uncultured bacterium]
MKITLIKPNMGQMLNGPYIDEGRMEPLQLGLLAAMCPPSVEVNLIDDRCEEIIYKKNTDLVAITVESFTARRAYEISDRYRLLGVPVILGGVHISLMPDEALLHADSILIGDAESVWDELLNDAASGKLKKIYYENKTSIPQSGIFPKRELFQGKKYLPITLTQFSRGCIHACNFCAVNAVFKQKHYVRPVREVIKEIELQANNIVFFVDDNIVANPSAAKILFRELIPLHIKWVSQGSIDMVYDSELMDLMCESGCLGNVIGFESINPQTLSLMGKQSNLHDFDSYEKAMEIIKSYGLQTWAAFILGNDEDTRESLYNTLQFALHHKFTFAAFNVLMPYPKTFLYNKLKNQNRLLYDGKWWLHPDYRFNYAAFKPVHMSADELTEISLDLRKKWNSMRSVLNRFFDIKTNMRSLNNMAIYWTYNPIFRRETFKKQGMRLGMESLK